MDLDVFIILDSIIIESVAQYCLNLKYKTVIIM